VPVFKIPGLIESRVCFLPMITPLSYAMLRLHRHYTEGFLPGAGGILDQANRYVEAMECLDAEFAKIKNEIAEKARRK
jgi:hypothetical protein